MFQQEYIGTSIIETQRQETGGENRIAFDCKNNLTRKRARNFVVMYHNLVSIIIREYSIDADSHLRLYISLIVLYNRICG